MSLHKSSSNVRHDKERQIRGEDQHKNSWLIDIQSCDKYSPSWTKTKSGEFEIPAQSDKMVQDGCQNIAFHRQSDFQD
jgi:hypothetical protein